VPYESGFLAWPEHDQDHALAREIHERESCGGCGTHPAVWDPARGGHPQALIASTYTCPGCKALVRKRREVESWPDLARDGVSVVLIPNPDL
jgi:hypothetical protein